MSEKEYSRRNYLKNSTLTGLGVGLSTTVTPNLFAGVSKDAAKAAIIGDSPVRTKGWPELPMLDFDGYVERNQCPQTDQLSKEAVWFRQSMLLGSKSDMNDIAMAIEKIHKNADKIN